ITGSLTSEGPKISFSLLLATAGSLSGPSAPSYCWNDRNFVPVGDFGAEPRAEADVLVVQVDVDELPQLPALVEEPVLEARVAGVERLDRRAQVGPADLNSDLAVRQPAERAGNSELCHAAK